MAAEARDFQGSLALWRTTPFRLLAIHGAVFLAGVLALTGGAYFTAARYLGEQGDQIVIGQAAALRRLPPETLANQVRQAQSEDVREVSHYGLLGANGRPIAGDVKRIPVTLPWDGMPHPLHDGAFQPGARGLVAVLDDGRILFVAYDAKTLSGVRDILIASSLWAAGGMIIIGLILSALTGLGPIRRVAQTRKAAQRLKDGDLSVRFPVTRRGDEIDALSDVINTVIPELERLLLEVKSVGDAVAHDLKTPLNRLRADLHRALQTWEQGNPRGEVADALEATDVLLGRFKAIERIAEVDRRDRHSGFAPFEVRRLILDMEEMFAPLAEEAGLHFEVETPLRLALVADQELLAEALFNLLDNAVKFNQAGGRVKLFARMQGGDLWLGVEDDGPGAPDSDLQQITQRFFRSARDRGRPGGGLGLSIVAAVARLHAYELRLENLRPGLRVSLICPDPAAQGAAVSADTVMGLPASTT